jgi:cytochrome c oxidase subunit II
MAGCASGKVPDQRVQVLMKKYTITPAEIRVKQGELVQFEVTTADVQHGFDVPGLGIKQSVQPGRPTAFFVRPERKGQFKVECGVLCGPHHEDMQGIIIVE